MKNITLLSLALSLFPVSVFAANTSAVLACLPQATKAIEPLNYPNGVVAEDIEVGAILCANVNSASDIRAVIACYNQAQGTAEKPGPAFGNEGAAATLCAQVKS